MTTLLCAALLLASDAISLPKPQTDGGKPLMQALKLRSSTREFRPDAMPPQVMSNLLWAAFGINRPDGKRTAPSTHGKNEIDIYVITAAGAYLYDATAHRLNLISKEDLRKPAGTQDFVETAPVNLIYVADTTAFDAPTPEEKLHWLGADAGIIAQNVGLFCASEGLGNVVRAGFDRDVLTKALKLEPKHRIILAQTVGYPRLR
jgi:SagB-type dehydrogenase family enzyme